MTKEMVLEQVKARLAKLEIELPPLKAELARWKAAESDKEILRNCDSNIFVTTPEEYNSLSTITEELLEKVQVRYNEEHPLEFNRVKNFILLEKNTRLNFLYKEIKELELKEIPFVLNLTLIKKSLENSDTFVTKESTLGLVIQYLSEQLHSVSQLKAKKQEIAKEIELKNHLSVKNLLINRSKNHRNSEFLESIYPVGKYLIDISNEYLMRRSWREEDCSSKVEDMSKEAEKLGKKLGEILVAIQVDNTDVTINEVKPISSREISR